MTGSGSFIRGVVFALQWFLVPPAHAFYSRKPIGEWIETDLPGLEVSGHGLQLPSLWRIPTAAARLTGGAGRRRPDPQVRPDGRDRWCARNGALLLPFPVFRCALTMLRCVAVFSAFSFADKAVASAAFVPLGWGHGLVNLQETVGFANEFSMEVPVEPGREWLGRRLAGGVRYEGEGWNN